MTEQNYTTHSNNFCSSYIETPSSRATMEITNSTETWTLGNMSLGSAIPPEDSAYSKLLENFRSTLYKHKEIETVILVVLYVPVFLMAFFGNLMVLLVILPNRHMRNVTNFFIVNLAVADLTGNSLLLIN